MKVGHEKEGWEGWNAEGNDIFPDLPKSSPRLLKNFSITSLLVK
jgi:hypothetical protein